MSCAMPKARSLMAIPTKCRRWSIFGPSAATPSPVIQTGYSSRLRAKAKGRTDVSMRWSVLAGGVLLAAAGLLSACAGTGGSAAENKVHMAPISFNEIPGWANDRQGEALVAFKRSCPKLTSSPDNKIVTDGGEKTITAAEWKTICDAAAGIKD